MKAEVFEALRTKRRLTESLARAYFFFAAGSRDGVMVDADGAATTFFGCFGFFCSRLLRC
jgi:hypothetical protein